MRRAAGWSVVQRRANAWAGPSICSSAIPEARTADSCSQLFADKPSIRLTRSFRLPAPAESFAGRTDASLSAHKHPWGIALKAIILLPTRPRECFAV